MVDLDCGWEPDVEVMVDKGLSTGILLTGAAPLHTSTDDTRETAPRRAFALAA